MGYPMTFSRLIRRNWIDIDQGYESPTERSSVSGDMKRFVEDTMDHQHVEFFARISGATEDQVRLILALVFDSNRDLTINGQPIGFGMGKDDAELIDGAKLGETLTIRADRLRIEVLEAAVQHQQESFMEFVSRTYENFKRYQNITAQDRRLTT